MNRKPRISEREHIEREFDDHHHPDGVPLEEEITREYIHGEHHIRGAPVSFSYPAPGGEAVTHEKTPTKSYSRRNKPADEIRPTDYYSGQSAIDLFVEAEELFGRMPEEQKTETLNRLLETGMSPVLMHDILGYFWTENKPKDYLVVEDDHMKDNRQSRDSKEKGPMYFISQDVITYLLENFEGDVDLSKGIELILAVRDNPNIICDELFNGRVVVPRLDKMISGRPANLTDSYRDDPRSSAHFYEHAATRHED